VKVDFRVAMARLVHYIGEDVGQVELGHDNTQADVRLDLQDVQYLAR
jgi:hypothetical protein